MKTDMILTCKELTVVARSNHTVYREKVPNKWIIGTTRCVRFEGKFWEIADDRGDRFDPINLPDRFKQDGLRVKFNLKELWDKVSFNLWHPLVRIIEIKRL